MHDTLPRAYGVKNKNEEQRQLSRSGGMFPLLAQEIFFQRGVVYGCLLTDSLEVIHQRADNMADAKNFSGSKYVQSNLGNTFLAVKKDLENGRKVLFSGTPCQVDGLKSFLKKPYDNLLLTDIVCHGVPSPRVWEDYVRWQEKRLNKSITSVDFRDKSFGWSEHVESLFLSDGRKISSKIWTTLFYSDCITRPSCFHCPYKNIYHPSDITLADFWGVDEINQNFNDNKGVSLVFLNTCKGEQFFEAAKKYVDCFPCSPTDSPQAPLSHAYDVPEERPLFWQEYEHKNFQYIAQKYAGHIGASGKIKKIIKRLLPNKIVELIKKHKR